MKTRIIEKFLLTVVLLELFLGGGGRLTEIGTLTLRMYLFALCMAWVALRLAGGASGIVPIQTWRLLGIFFCAICVAALVGVVRGSGIEAIAGDLKPLMYFPMILFFTMAIRGKDDVEKVSMLIVLSGIIQAFAYLSVLAIAHAGVVSYQTIYFFLAKLFGELTSGGEIGFRGNAPMFFLGFFYKGFLYMCVAFIFLLIDPVRRNLWLALMVLAAIVFTFTRGFLASLLLTFGLGTMVLREKMVLILMLLGVAVGAFMLSADLVEPFRRAVSDEVRIADLRTVWGDLDLPTLLAGKGFGTLIGERERIEMTYIEVLYKQGLIGMAFWVYLLFVNLAAFGRVPRELRKQAFVFLLAGMFVYIQTSTNHFLNNSIGMGMVLLSTVVLLALARTETGRDRRGGQGDFSLHGNIQWGEMDREANHECAFAAHISR